MPVSETTCRSGVRGVGRGVKARPCRRLPKQRAQQRARRGALRVSGCVRERAVVAREQRPACERVGAASAQRGGVLRVRERVQRRGRVQRLAHGVEDRLERRAA
eukprot:126010-Pleurochrysis_carterae.AAC.2